MSCINRFKVRQNIVLGKIFGEFLAVQQSDVSDWLEKVWSNLCAMKIFLIQMRLGCFIN